MSGSEITKSRRGDIERLLTLEPGKMAELLLAHTRTVFRVDGLYFLGIEKRFGTEAATEIDRECWAVMGTLEARALKKLLPPVGSGIENFVNALLLTSWSLDQPHKEVNVEPEKGRARYRVKKCMTQHARLKKDLSVFPCKPVREGYLRSFTREFDPTIQLVSAQAPPDQRPEDLWCEWIFEESEN